MYRLRIVCAVAVLSFPSEPPAQSQSKSKISAAKKPLAPSDLPAPNFKKCEEFLANSVVRIQLTGSTGSRGAGFSVGDGTVVVTNDHLVRHGRTEQVEEELTLKFADGTAQKAKVVLTMPHRDLAALRLQEAVQPLLLAEEDQFVYQSPVMILGHSEGVENLQNIGKLTDLSRWSTWKVRSSNLALANDTLLLKTDAMGRSAQSASPLVTPDGLVVGALTFIERSNAQGNAAVHVSHIRELLEKVDPNMKLPSGKLSNVERIRIERLRRLDALAQLAEQRKSSTQNGVTDATPLRMFFRFHEAAIRGMPLDDRPRRKTR